MNFDLHEPQRGDRLSAARTAALMREVRSNRLLQSPGVRVHRTPHGTHIEVEHPKQSIPPRKPLPYEVRFDGTLEDGDGGWKIYLPTDHLLSLNGEDIDTSDITGITVIEDANGDATGWYSFDDIDLQDDHVWLVIKTTPAAEGSGSAATVEAEFAATEGQSVSGEEVVNICIAEIDYSAPANEGGAPTIEINQSVVGALHLGGAADVVLIGNDDSPGSEALVRPKIMFSNAQDQSGNAIANVSITAEEDAQDSSLTHVKIGVFYV